LELLHLLAELVEEEIGKDERQAKGIDDLVRYEW